MATKEEFFKVVREKKELEKKRREVESVHYDDTIWEGTDEEIANGEKDIEALRKDIEAKREVLTEMRKSFTKPELRAMRKEFYGKSN